MGMSSDGCKLSLNLYAKCVLLCNFHKDKYNLRGWYIWDTLLFSHRNNHRCIIVLTLLSRRTLNDIPITCNVLCRSEKIIFASFPFWEVYPQCNRGVLFSSRKMEKRWLHPPTTPTTFPHGNSALNTRKWGCWTR